MNFAFLDYKYEGISETQPIVYSIPGFQYSLTLHPEVQPDTLKQLNNDWSGSDISMFQTIKVLAHPYTINLLDAPPQLVGHKP